jgi:hypothetical protein
MLMKILSVLLILSLNASTALPFTTDDLKKAQQIAATSFISINVLNTITGENNNTLDEINLVAQAIQGALASATESGNNGMNIARILNDINWDLPKAHQGWSSKRLENLIKHLVQLIVSEVTHHYTCVGIDKVLPSEEARILRRVARTLVISLIDLPIGYAKAMVENEYRKSSRFYRKIDAWDYAKEKGLASFLANAAYEIIGEIIRNSAEDTKKSDYIVDIKKSLKNFGKSTKEEIVLNK